jgi:hypothetical protein
MNYHLNLCKLEYFDKDHTFRHEGASLGTEGKVRVYFMAPHRTKTNLSHITMPAQRTQGSQ